MFKYKYKGKVPYVDQNYGLYNVKPGDEVEVEYALPSYLTDFELIAVDNPITEQSKDYSIAINSSVTINAAGYQSVDVVLLNPESAKVLITQTDSDLVTDGITLDTNLTRITLANPDEFTITAQEVSGQTTQDAQVRVYFNLSDTKIGG